MRCVTVLLHLAAVRHITFPASSSLVLLRTSAPSACTALADEEDDDLSADGPIARRIREEIAAHVPLPDDKFRVGDTGDTRGLALYATAPIESGTYLFDYGGALLQQKEFDTLYPLDGARADYAVGIMQPNGTSVYIDAAKPECSNLARYMNHEPHEPNCIAWSLAASGIRLLMFAAREVSVGEELVWDYGERYWSGRDDMIVADDDSRPSMSS